MAGKKMEGNEEQRRQKARETKRRGRRPSEEAGTLGASKPRHHLAHDEDHVEKLATVREGKQPSVADRVADPEPRPRSRH